MAQHKTAVTLVRQQLSYRCVVQSHWYFPLYSAIEGYPLTSLYPETPGQPSAYTAASTHRHIIFTAETHNFPTGGWNRSLCCYYLSLVVQIWWNIDFAVVPFSAVRLLWYFTHVMTAQLICHEQNLVTIPLLGCEQYAVFTEFESQQKNC